ncbi:MAG: hypothetical protein H6835_10985 [Planctomycetes bacterium]|nr:hypothetical protein [Planctomycetota bacterium]
MDWLDRSTELARLQTFARRPNGGLAVVWGRRRVGKTRLLLEWCRRQQGVYHVADESAPPQQRRRLAQSLEAALPGFADVDYPDWATLLSRLARDAKQAGVRGPFVIDELPYLVASSPDLPAMLQRFVDHDAKQARLALAVAGSSQRMMQGLVLDAGAPLFGRATEAFELRPLPPNWIATALGVRRPVEAVQAWAVWGGMPRYWELASEHADRRTAVDHLVLDPLGALHDEPQRLLLEELPPAVALKPILDAIGSGANKISEIAGRIGAPATSLARSMTRLLEMSLVVRETPFGEPERSTKRALYRLADPFLRLWFSLVAPKRAQLAQLPRSRRLQLFDERAPHLDAAAWEELCRLAVPRLEGVLGLPFGRAQRYWRGGDPEFDIVATDDGDTHLLGEVKWSPETASADMLAKTYAQLLAKGAPPRADANIVRALFVPRLPPKRPKSIPPELHLIDAATVMAAFAD